MNLDLARTILIASLRKHPNNFCDLIGNPSVERQVIANARNYIKVDLFEVGVSNAKE